MKRRKINGSYGLEWNNVLKRFIVFFEKCPKSVHGQNFEFL